MLNKSRSWNFGDIQGVYDWIDQNEYYEVNYQEMEKDLNEWGSFNIDGNSVIVKFDKENKEYTIIRNYR